VVLKVEPGHSAALRVRLDALNALLAQSTNSNEAGWLRAGIRQAAAQLQQ